MPKNIKTKDGIEIMNIPDNIDTKGEAMRDYVVNLRNTQGSGRSDFSIKSIRETQRGDSGFNQPPQEEPQQGFTPTATDKFPSFQQLPEESGVKTTAEGIAGGLVRELAPVVAGTAIGGPAGGAAVTLAKVAGDPITGLVNRIFGTEFVEPSQALEQLFTSLGVAEPKSEVEKFIQATAGAVSETAGTIGLGKVLQTGKSLAPTIKKGVGKVLASKPVEQIAGTIGAATGTEIAEQAGAGPVVQTVAGISGGILGSGLTGLKTTPAKSQLLTEAKKTGVKVLTSDVKPPRTFIGRSVQSAAEKIPVFGTGITRKGQQKQRIAAVKDLMEQFGAGGDDISDDIMKDLLNKRSDKLTLYTTAKKEVIEKLSETPAAAKKTIANLDEKINTLNTDIGKLKSKKIKVGTELKQIADMETQVKNLQGLKSKNVDNVPVTKTINAINKEIKKLESLNTKEVQPVINKLNDWKASIQDQDLQNIELLRKQLGESFKAPELAGVRSTGEKSLTSIYGAIRDDMGDYISSKGTKADFNKWMISNKRLSSMMDDLKVTSVKNTLNKGEATPELVKNLLFSKKKSEVTALYKGLAPKGKASARTAILSKVAESSKFPESEIISPDKFANNVRKLGMQTGVFFDRQDTEQIKGLVRVLNATKRASQAGVLTNTGVQAAVPTSIAAISSFVGGGVEGFVKLLAGATTAGTIANFYESKAVRDLLVKLPTVAKNSVQEEEIFKRLAETARAMQNKKEK
jgi:predicted  nucleic acid-binding Zn-ribbon protein